jgi:8-oxo-dGTP diphosphatase
VKTNLVSCCILKNKNKFLVSQRPLSKIFANFWEFPGGKLENNESFQNAIIRELKEELGIIVNKKNLINLDVITHAYKKNEITILSIFFLKKMVRNCKCKRRTENRMA